LEVASREVWSALMVWRETTGLHSNSDRSRYRFGAMNRPSLHGLRAGRVPAVPGGVGLRSDHPLARATEAAQYTGRQWIHVAAVLIGSAIARIEGRQWAGPLALSAASVLLILTVVLAAHKQRERDCAIELVLEGGEGIPIAAVQRQRRRLLAKQTRNGLAGNLEDMIRQAASRSRPRPRVTPLPFEPMVVRMVAGELRDVIGLLRAEEVNARGVARAERLVERAVSPLYGQDAYELREELRRVRDLLENGGM
jgi:hypothetical protein